MALIVREQMGAPPPPPPPPAPPPPPSGLASLTLGKKLMVGGACLALGVALWRVYVTPP